MAGSAPERTTMTIPAAMISAAPAPITTCQPEPSSSTRDPNPVSAPGADPCPDPAVADPAADPELADVDLARPAAATTAAGVTFAPPARHGHAGQRAGPAPGDRGAGGGGTGQPGRRAGDARARLASA